MNLHDYPNDRSNWSCSNSIPAAVYTSESISIYCDECVSDDCVGPILKEVRDMNHYLLKRRNCPKGTRHPHKCLAFGADPIACEPTAPLHRRQVHFTSTDGGNDKSIISPNPGRDKGKLSQKGERGSRHERAEHMNACNKAQKSDKISSSCKSQSDERQTPKTSQRKSSSFNTYLPHLDLGDEALPQDMVQCSDQSEIDSLRRHDFAFVLRSDGRSWTYAIVADRQDDAVRFVVDANGSTKVLSRKNWKACIRLVRRREKEVVLTPSPSSVRHMRVVGEMPPPSYPRKGSVLSLFD